MPAVEVEKVDTFKSEVEEEKEFAGPADEDDRDDPFGSSDDSDVSDDLMPDRVDLSGTQKANTLVQEEMRYQEAQDTAVINQELARSGQQELPVDESALHETVHDQRAGDISVGDQDLDQYVGDQAYQMYQELLDIVRKADDEESPMPVDDDST